eukprot:TRINITY_DN18824_c1_g1_i1.p1 TRINITY_DN18824_c1_g1~~TRINITY_DN18824_c1_g1_i1.p1  ORF type:complete len:529 (-),score=54.52 TRINITY_DN18824_c1_g1_i1:308-1894(-)
MENHRVRKVILYYYLEDDTMHVAEPRSDNSGLPQGMSVKRHKVVRQDGTFYNPKDFRLGKTVLLYGRCVYLVDADDFTKQYMQENLDINIGEPQSYPDDPIDARRDHYARKTATLGPPHSRYDDLTKFLEAMLGKPPTSLGPDMLRQFLENNRHVLRFWVVWDDRGSLYGDRRPYVLHYFLEDDTIEVLEINEQNSSRDPFPVFLKRGPLPRQVSGQSLGTRRAKSDCYKPSDLRLGEVIQVLNRDMLLFDCDSYTKEWYRENLGFDDQDLQAAKVQEKDIPLPQPAIPPYNGYGTLDDSKQNCISLVPQPPKKDLRKLVNKDGMILRFVSQYKETTQFRLSYADRDRRFILSYYMADDTVQIYEPPLRNSGIIGGKFLERCVVYKPGTEEPYNYKDLYVGAHVDIHGRVFELLEADEYTYTYMENNKHMFIMADPDAIMKLLRAQVRGNEEQMRTCFIEIDKDGSGELSTTEFLTALLGANLTVTKHQCITLCRFLDKDDSGEVSVEEFLGALGIRRVSIADDVTEE